MKGERRLKEGEVVFLKPSWKIRQERHRSIFGTPSFLDSMARYCGQKVTVTKITGHNDGWIFRIVEDGDDYAWHSAWIENNYIQLEDDLFEL